MGDMPDTSTTDTSRRTFLLGTLALAPVLSSCNRDEGDSALIASAARGSDRKTFVDAIGWSEADGQTAVVVFVPFKMDSEQRRRVVEARSVFPTLPTDEPILELRMQIRKGEDLKINTRNLRSLQFTFWYFDDPVPVVKVENSEWPSSPEMDVQGLDGEMRRGGWIVGTVRSRHIYKNSRSNDEAYLVNLRFAESLS